MEYQACLIYIRTHPGNTQDQIHLQGRLDDGRSFGMVIQGYRPGFHIPLESRDSALGILGKGPHPRVRQSDYKTMGGEDLLRLEFDRSSDHAAAHRMLRSASIPCYEGDLTLVQQFMLEHGLGLYLRFEADEKPGRRVDAVFEKVKFLPGQPDFPAEQLRILALDIETDRSSAIRCISLAGWGGDLILMLDRGLGNGLERELDSEPEVQREQGVDPVPDAPAIQSFHDERQLLEAFAGEIRRRDPDIITGWNVVGFDMNIILRRMTDLGLEAALGRSSIEARYMAGEQDLPDIAELPGRQVIDAMRLLRMHPRHFESYSLEAVARQLLGRGKRESFEDEDKMDALDRLWQDDPFNFVLYCLKDSRLVLEILEATGLMNLTFKRSELCRTVLSRSWASIHAFETLYIHELHQKGFAAPDQGVDSLPMNESPGGTILDPESGIFDAVLLLDFKGLYPSIIRSFGIDPLGHIRAKKSPASALRSPNGAAFLPEEGILPGLLDRFYRLREEAKARGDETASFAFKILGNSFYGVLGSPGCRFAGSDIATAITSFAREILHFARDHAREQGFRAIYGDTDSLFLLPPEGTEASSIFFRGQELASSINESLRIWVRERYGRESRLEIEFEQVLAPLYIPPLKSVSSQEVQQALEDAGLSGPQGRAKSYGAIAWNQASAYLQRSQQPLVSGPGGKLIIKGMEAVRSDWTALARRVQRDVLEGILRGGTREQVVEYLTEVIADISAGRNKEELVIQKRLSKAASAYRGNVPPHVRAALEAEAQGHRQLRRIRYLMTANGPRPCMTRRELSALKPDIHWYMERQILPVLQTLNLAVSWDLVGSCRALYAPDGQLGLW